MESEEIKILKQTFTQSTKIQVKETIEETHVPHWKRLVLPQLNSTELYRVAYYIMMTFSKPDTYSHNLPKVHSYQGKLVLTVSVNQIKEHLLPCTAKQKKA